MPVARWCGSSNVCDSEDADPTVQATAATTNPAVKIPRHERRCLSVITLGGAPYHLLAAAHCRVVSSMADSELVTLSS
jgi:hypothetical protein